MNVGDVRTEIETALKTITGLRVAGWGEKTAPPVALVTLPEAVNFHQTYGVGSTRITDLIVMILAARTTNRSAVSTLMPYVAETGTKSIKAKLEGYAWTSLEVMTVVSAEFDAVDYFDAPMLAVMFHLDIAGKGAV